MPVETCAICQLHGDPAARGRYEIERSELWVSAITPTQHLFPAGSCWIHCVIARTGGFRGRSFRLGVRSVMPVIS